MIVRYCPWKRGEVSRRLDEDGRKRGGENRMQSQLSNLLSLSYRHGRRIVCRAPSQRCLVSTTVIPTSRTSAYHGRVQGASAMAYLLQIGSHDLQLGIRYLQRGQSVPVLSMNSINDFTRIRGRQEKYNLLGLGCLLRIERRHNLHDMAKTDKRSILECFC